MKYLNRCEEKGLDEWMAGINLRRMVIWLNEKMGRRLIKSIKNEKKTKHMNK